MSCLLYGTIEGISYQYCFQCMHGSFDYQEFIDKLIEEDEFDADQKDAFKNFVKDNVREAKKANRQAREARKKALQK
uniref:Uncharacterized protein n=1 Tax=Vitis vinifera TaxID=29760 RepID=F6GYP1_VITVI